MVEVQTRVVGANANPLSLTPEMAVRSYIALGSNLNNPLDQVSRAIKELTRLPSTHLLSQSTWYRTAPVGPAGQPDYINGVVEIETALEPIALLDALQSIENKHSRVRERRWGPRTLDLDMLLYGEQRIQNTRLVVPHPEMKNRNFVLYPLYDIAPTLILPCSTPLKQLLENCSPAGMVRL